MDVLSKNIMEKVSGAMKWQGLPLSRNVFDARGVTMQYWIDAANMCWKPGTSSKYIYPAGAKLPNFRF